MRRTCGRAAEFHNVAQMNDSDIETTARSFARQHGAEAEKRAWAEADKMLTVWDIDGFHMWKKVMEAIREAQAARTA